MRWRLQPLWRPPRSLSGERASYTSCRRLRGATSRTTLFPRASLLGQRSVCAFLQEGVEKITCEVFLFPEWPHSRCVYSTGMSNRIDRHWPRRRASASGQPLQVIQNSNAVIQKASVAIFRKRCPVAISRSPRQYRGTLNLCQKGLLSPFLGLASNGTI